MGGGKVKKALSLSDVISTLCHPIPPHLTYFLLPILRNTEAGDPLGKGYGGTRILLKAEFGSKSHNTGAVNMARVSSPTTSASSTHTLVVPFLSFSSCLD